MGNPVSGITSGAGNVVVADFNNHAIRAVAKEGAVVSTLAGGRQEDDDENDAPEGQEDEATLYASIYRGIRYSLSVCLCAAVHLHILQEEVEEEAAPQLRVGVMSLEVFEDKLFSGGDDSIVRIWNTNNWS